MPIYLSIYCPYCQHQSDIIDWVTLNCGLFVQLRLKLLFLCKNILVTQYLASKGYTALFSIHDIVPV